MSHWIKMTKEEAIVNHRRLWNEIADMLDRGERCNHVDVLKRQALNNIGEENDIHNNCYCCEYAKNDCSRCPVIWNNESYDDYMCEIGYEDDFSIYVEHNSEWANFLILIGEKDYDTAAKIAREIANLPERREENGTE